MYDRVWLPADAQAAEVVQPGESPLDDPTPASELCAVFVAAAGDHGLDAAAPLLVVVIAAVGDGTIRARPGPTAPARHWVDPIHQRQKLGDVVAVGAGESGRQGNAVGVDDQMML